MNKWFGKRISKTSSLILMLLERPLPVKSFSISEGTFYKIIWVYSGLFFSSLIAPKNGSPPPVDATLRNFGEITFISTAFAWVLFLMGMGILFFANFQRRSELKRVVSILLISVLTAFHLKMCILERIVVDGNSMEPTLKNGDHLWFEKVTTGIYLPVLSFPFDAPSRALKIPRNGLSLPARGSIVLLHYPGSESRYLIKRVAAHPGDTFQFLDGNFILNGKPVEEPYLFEKKSTYSIPDIYQLPITDVPEEVKNQMDPVVAYSALYGCGDSGVVPQDTILLLGDNRRNSRDSRSIGFVPLMYLLGRAVGH